MSATSCAFMKKGSGAKYIKNRPYTANCAKRVSIVIDGYLKLLR